MKRARRPATSRFSGCLLALALSALPLAVRAQPPDESRLAVASALLEEFTADDEQAIPSELLHRARGIAVIPKVLRGGFIVGARHGRGVLIVRTERGDWSNPAFITLTGGSVGGQIGMESTDLVLIFANDDAVKNMSSGKFTLGGDASAIAGPVGRHVTGAVTFKAEVYVYAKSHGLFAGASFEGARLAIDEEAGTAFYGADSGARALGEQSDATPASARRFLLTIEALTTSPGPESAQPPEPAQEAVTHPLECARVRLTASRQA